MQEVFIKLRSGSSGRLKPGHPWVYSKQILEVGPGVTAGSIVSVVDNRSQFVGRGYYNPKSDIAVRLLTRKNESIDAAFLSRKIQRAIEKRSSLLPATNAYRAVFSEADDLPGLIADIYGDTLVFQILTLGMERLKPAIVEGLKLALSPKYIFEKSESAFRKIEGLADVNMWWGDKGQNIVEIYEGKARFLVDIEHGHKTGFYLDQRRSRFALSDIVRGRSVLDLFCYTGGFAVHAALGGAKSVTAIDIKSDWLELGKKNAELNGAAGKITFARKDAFTALRDLRKGAETFDVIILDPPSFLKTKRELSGAIRGYKELNMTAMKIINDGGVLATFSCSHNMPNELFSDILKDAARDAKKDFTILKRCRQDKDHPVVNAIPETEYLKGYFLKVAPVI